MFYTYAAPFVYVGLNVLFKAAAPPTSRARCPMENQRLLPDREGVLVVGLTKRARYRIHESKVKSPRYC